MSKPTLSEMTREERSLLLYLEVRATDHGGLVTTAHMNKDDDTIINKWKENGFIEYGRLTRESIESLRGSTHWVKLSEDAWSLAHQERRARFERIYLKRTWQTTQEKRS